MNAIEEFLELPDLTEMKETITINYNGKPLEFVVRPINDTEFKDYQKRSQKRQGNRIVIDDTKIRACILENNIVEPDFNNAEFLRKAGCVTGIEFLERKFPSGVLQDIVAKVLEISGFDNDINVEIEEAKN